MYFLSYVIRSVRSEENIISMFLLFLFCCLICLIIAVVVGNTDDDDVVVVVNVITKNLFHVKKKEKNMAFSYKLISPF